MANLVAMWITDPCMDNRAQFGWLDVGPDFLFEAGVIDAPLHASLTSDACVSGPRAGALMAPSNSGVLERSRMSRRTHPSFFQEVP